MMKFKGLPVSFFPVLKDVLTAKSIEDSYGFLGIKKANDYDALEIFMVRRFIEEFKIIDTIPNNRDMFGKLPSMDSTTFNEDYTIAYTSYDEAGKGRLMVQSNRQYPRVIIDDNNIFGPVRIAEKMVNGFRIKIIMYCTYTDGEVRLKICNIDGELIMDITDLL